VALPERLRLQFIGLMGDDVRPWLDALPDLVDRLCAAWEVDLDRALDGGWSSYVACGTRFGEPVVLKVVPEVELGRAEIAGLVARNGVGVPRLIRADRSTAALLLERVLPGAQPSPDDVDAPRVAEVLGRLHLTATPASADVPSLSERLAVRWSRRVPADLQLEASALDGAARVAETLSSNWDRPLLLHGDFEARNLLVARTGLVAIDSPAAIGDPGFDLACWALSQSHGDPAGLGPLLDEIATALGYPPERARQWAWPLAVDSLFAKLHEPGWPAREIDEAMTVAWLLTP
jgi:streptomycin 6-kinase